MLIIECGQIYSAVMPHGPLPNRTHVHRIKPTVPTMDLPVEGRRGRCPTPPVWCHLGPAGLAWWKWAWFTPQAAAWSTGDLVAVAHRAVVEDVLADLVRIEDADGEAVVAAGRAKLSAIREASSLDDKLGLSPKAMAQLRWKIVETAVPVAAQVADLDDRRKRLATG